MQVINTPIDDLIVLSLEKHNDLRGSFHESYNFTEYFNKAGIVEFFVQDNVSISKAGVIRGLHFQDVIPQMKIISVIQGSIFDVAVDLRRDSKTFGKHYSININTSNNFQLVVPKYFAHGFLAMEDNTIVSYKCSSNYVKEYQNGIIYNDSDLNILWPDVYIKDTYGHNKLIHRYLLSDKDQKLQTFKDFCGINTPQP